MISCDVFHLYSTPSTATNMNLIFVPKDLALLKIDPPFEVNDKIQPIQINDVYEDLIGEEVLISGWGKTTTNRDPRQLRSLRIKITNSKRIPPPYRNHTFIQMLSSKGEGACNGDSGGNHAIQLKKYFSYNIEFNC